MTLNCFSMRRHLALFLGSVLMGCVTTQPGAVVRRERISGSERVVASVYDLRTTSLPTPATPVLTLQLRATNRQRYEEQTFHQGVQRYSVSLNLLSAAFWGGVGIPLWKKGDERWKETGDSAALFVKFSGGAAVALSAWSLITAFRAMGSDAPNTILEGNVIPGRRSAGFEDVVAAVPSAPIRVAIDSQAVQVLTGPDGTARVNLASAFVWPQFFAELDVPVVASSPLIPTPLSMSLHSSQFAQPCVRASGSGSVLDRASAAGMVVGEYRAGDLFALRSEDVVDWYEITYRGAAGWIPQVNAIRCWTAQTMAK